VSEPDTELDALMKDPKVRDELIAKMLAEAADEHATSAPRWMHLGAVGSLLFDRFRETGAAEDLDKAVWATGESVRTTPPSTPGFPTLLMNLVVVCLARYHRAHESNDLDDAIDAGRQIAALGLTDDPQRGRCLLSLTEALQIRGSHDDHSALDEAIETHYLNLRGLSAADPVRETVYERLINCLLVRFHLRGDADDLHRAVRTGEEAIASLPEEVQRIWMGNNLALALIARFDLFGALDDLTGSIELLRRASAAVPCNGGMLRNLSYALTRRFENLGNEADMHEAITVAEAAVQFSDEDQLRVENLRNLGNALRNRFNWTGGIEDVTRSIRTLRQAVDGLEADAPAQSRAMYLSDLANALRTRFYWAGDRLARNGETADLDEAIHLLREAVSMVRDEDTGRPKLMLNLSVALSDRFEQTRRDDDVEQAVTTAVASLRGLPRGGRLWIVCQEQLAMALQSRFKRTSDPRDMDRAIAARRTGLDGCPPEHAMRALMLTKLGACLLARRRHLGDREAGDEAIDVFHRAAESSLAGSPYWAISRSSLGDALHARFELSGRPEDIDSAIGWWREVATAGHVRLSSRIAAARAWGNHANSRNDREGALTAYTTVVELLPLCTWQRVRRIDRERLLEEWEGLATTTAATAIAVGRPRQALELLEKGRGILWSQVLETRNDRSTLLATAPELAERITEVRAALDATPPRSDSASAPEWADRRVDHQLALAEEWEALTRLARSRHESTGLSHRPAVDWPAELEHDDAVVVVNVAPLRCDAVVITSDDVRVVPLPHLTAEDAVIQVNRHLTALQAYEYARRDPVAGVELELTITSLLEWLWDVVAEPVLASLGHRGPPPADGRRPRLWWSPTGPLTLAPLHAAGYHAEGGGRTVLDRVISSYAPTLRALHQARSAEAQPKRQGELLVVAMPTTPGHAALPDVEREHDTLIRLFGSGAVKTLREERADRRTVSAALAHHSWVHFACHGRQDLADPSSGGVVLQDGLLTLSDLGTGDRASGEFVYLSACRTAVGGVATLDEAMTLVAAFQHAGWQHIIGTLWAVCDTSAADIATAFYTRQHATGSFRPATSARSLHHAVRQSRDLAPTRPSTWAPFVHTGL
jgi:tetratricopeptide (TPR) repeat protein